MNNTSSYTYDSNHNLLTATTPENVVTTNTYDANGNVTSTRVGGSTDYIEASTTFDSASALASAVTDARGNSASYAYNTNTRQQTSVTDANGNTSTYAYGNASAMLRLASLTSPTGSGNNATTATVNYTYDQYGKLTTISRGSTDYSFTYNNWGDVLNTKVGAITLSTNKYDGYGRLVQVNYGNGFKTRYAYDSLDRVCTIYQGTATNASSDPAYEFIYNGEGDLYELRNYKTLRSTFFEYDHAGRCMASTEKIFTVSGSTVTYTGTVSGYRYKYDANNNLLELTCTVGNQSWTTNYYYDDDNRPTTVSLHNNATVTNTYDVMGRVASRLLATGSAQVNTSLTYASGANGSKTALVSSYQNGSDSAYNYTYDANGNITQIWRGSGSFYSASVRFSFTYDDANQLIREDLKFGTNNSNNATYTYTYDKWGNLLEKTRYDYTIGNLPNMGFVVGSYGYTDSQWGDLLTSFNNNSICYDSMGNPTRYLGKTLSWEGKRLISCTSSSTSISYDYNEDGLRLSKTVDGTVTEYYYNGSVLIGMKIGTGSSAKVLMFSYDASGNVVAVDYSPDNGSNFTTYYYLRNAQNDIVKIVDNSGSTKVEYIYDSWGTILSVTGSLANTVGSDQPFRYRGYVYDTETGWYYLQSRYYNPSVCRFISADVLLSTGQGIIGYNSFAYCNNNPVALVDEVGHAPRVNTWNMPCTDGKTQNYKNDIITYDDDYYNNTTRSVWSRAIEQGITDGLIGATAGFFTGLIAGALGAPFSGGLSIPACAGVTALLGFLGGAFEGIIRTLYSEL